MRGEPLHRELVRDLRGRATPPFQNTVYFEDTLVYRIYIRSSANERL